MNRSFMTLIVSAVGLISLLNLPAFAASDAEALQAKSTTEWVMQLDDEAIQVWTAKVKGSKFKQFKGAVQINAPIDAVVNLIQDTEQLPEWYYNTVSAKRLQSMGPNQSLKYAITKTPWPVTDRDSVVLGTKTFSEDGTITITLEGRPDEYPLQENLIRIPKLSGYWRITPTSTSSTHVEFMVAAEPGGEIPSWLANSMVIDMPFYTLRNLREKLENSTRKVSSHNFKN